MFPVYGGKCLSRKAVHNFLEIFLKDVRNSQIIPDQVRKWLEKDFYAAVFDALVKRWDKCVNVGGRYVEKYMFFFQVRISHIFTFHINL
jgi:hypothetical protein